MSMKACNDGLRICTLLAVAWMQVFPAFAADQWTPVPTAHTTDAQQSSRDAEQRLAQLISIEYKDADLSNVLRSLSWTYKLNIVTGPDIKGKVNINLQDISVEKALQAILTINGLVYSRRDDVIYVSAGDTETVGVKTEVIKLKYLTATQAQNMSKKVLSSKGDIKINETANNLIITDYPASIDKIRELLQQVDVAPKQVLIEAKIVDIVSNDLKSLGVTWTADYTPTQGGLFNRRTRFAEELKTTTTLGTTSSSLTGGQLVVNTLKLKGLTVGATIDALVRDGRANLLASPSIAVINGQEARIVIGEKFPIKERTQTTTGTTETTKFVDIGTTLKVNPQINDDGYITLSIHPEVSSAQSSLVGDAPRITTREADTTVRVKEGETLVIGGLIQQKDDSSRDRMPVLGYIPVLGYLFSRSASDKEQRELAVFITPRILFSREEQIALGHKKEETVPSTVLLDQTGPLTVVERIFEKGVALEGGWGLESKYKKEIFSKSQALNHYEVIYKEFPESQRAPEALYRAGKIYWEYYRNADKAKGLLSSIFSDYADSSFVEKAQKLYEKIEKASPKPKEKPKEKPEESKKEAPESSMTLAELAEKQGFTELKDLGLTAAPAEPAKTAEADASTDPAKSSKPSYTKDWDDLAKTW